jgi:methylase of polypeptide subunit release factors
VPRGPHPDPVAARALGDAVRRVGYNEEAVLAALGEDAYGGHEDVPLHLARVPDTKFGVVLRALFLAQRVPRDDAVAALGGSAVDALAKLGLAEVGAEVVPLCRVAPFGELLFSSDTFAVGDEEDPPDYVATYTPTSQLCDRLTPRPYVARALDVGTGNGVHALLAARHARSVVATDVNPRALAFTEINAALNGIRNVECVRGSLFEPVAGERFDLITCNAPYVISPEDRYAYRDGGLDGDDLSRLVVLGAAEHLADGGYATVLASWLGEDAAEPDERVIEWAEETGCDAWILSAETRGPLEHAEEWNGPLAMEPATYRAVLEEWVQYLDELGAACVTEGAVLLHRRDGDVGVRVDEIDPEEVDPAAEQIVRAFENRARFANVDDLLAERLAVAMPLLVELDVRPRRAGTAIDAARVRLEDGTRGVIDAPAEAAEIVPALDGTATLGEILDDVGAGAQARRETLELCEHLVELGALRFS